MIANSLRKAACIGILCLLAAANGCKIDKLDIDAASGAGRGGRSSPMHDAGAMHEPDTGTGESELPGDEGGSGGAGFGGVGGGGGSGGVGGGSGNGEVPPGGAGAAGGAGEAGGDANAASCGSTQRVVLNAADPESVLDLTVSEISSVTLVAANLTGPRGPLGVYKWSAPPIDFSTSIVGAGASRSDTTVKVNLPPGHYVVRTLQYNMEAGAFDLSVRCEAYPKHEPQPEPGGDKSAAHVIEVQTSAQERAGYVGPLDDEDYYQLTLTDSTTLVIDLVDPNNAVTLQLFQDAPTINESVALGGFSSRSNKNLTSQLPAGKYYVRVSMYSNEHALYTLSVFQTPYSEPSASPDPGDSKDSAFALGDITTVKTVAGYAGPLDAEDYYMFELTSPRNVVIDLVNPINAVTVGIFADAPSIDESQPLKSITARVTTRLNATGLAAGKYYVRVAQYSNEASLYTLNLLAQ